MLNTGVLVSTTLNKIVEFSQKRKFNIVMVGRLLSFWDGFSSSREYMISYDCRMLL